MKPPQPNPSNLARLKKFSPLTFALLGGGLIILGIIYVILTRAAGVEVGQADLAKGLVYDKLQKASDTKSKAVSKSAKSTSPPDCSGLYQLTVTKAGKTICSHGPDAAPAGIDVRKRRNPNPAKSALIPDAHAGGCDGSISGGGGRRIQAIYAHASDVPSRFSSYQTTLQTAATNASNWLNDSTFAAGGTSHLRFISDASCAPIITEVTLSAQGDDSFYDTVNELYDQGFTSPDRKYLIWVDANVYCGISSYYQDDRPALDNTNNIGTMWARIDNGCWGLPLNSSSVTYNSYIESHEIVHMLGAEMDNAPHATGAGHCNDGISTLCRSGDGGPSSNYANVCGSYEKLDCNNDDYYSPSPPPGSYLATHWNIASSGWLSAREPVYRLANYLTHERLFTTSVDERDQAAYNFPGWIYEQVSFTVSDNPFGSNYTPVYRLANYITKERLFTTSAYEKDAIKGKNGWVYEQVAFQAETYPTGNQPVYRLANYLTHERLFTTSAYEKDAINGKNGWVYEQVAFYVAP